MEITGILKEMAELLKVELGVNGILMQSSSAKQECQVYTIDNMNNAF